MGEEVTTTTTTTTVISATAEEEKPTAHFVLVHGISEGSWCWYKIKTLIENSGYKVSCVDLKSAGIDSSNPNLILSFDDYNQPLTNLLSSLPPHHQVILVGHSAGGLSVTHACHKFGNKIRLAIYVAATMLKFGFLTDQDFKEGVPDLSEFGNDIYDVEFGLGLDQPPTSAVIKKEFRRKIGFQMCPQEDVTLAQMLMKPGPMKAILSAQFKKPEKEEQDEIEEVPRVYIRTEYDHVVKPEQQKTMIKRWPPKMVFVLESDHHPVFSAPFLLFGSIMQAVNSLLTPPPPLSCDC